MLNLFKNEATYESTASNDVDKAVKLLLQLLKNNSDSETEKSDLESQVSAE